MQTTEIAALLNSRLIVSEYVSRIQAVENSLTHSSRFCNLSPEMNQLLAKDEEGQFLEHIHSFAYKRELYQEEPYRKRLRVMRYRSNRNKRPPFFSYMYPCK